MDVWRLVGFVGVALLAVGLFLGLAPMKVAALDGSQNCGSAFRGGDYQLAGSAVVAECDSKRTDRRTWAIALLIAGGVLGLAAVSQLPTPPEREAASDG